MFVLCILMLFAVSIGNLAFFFGGCGVVFACRLQFKNANIFIVEYCLKIL